MLLFPCSPPALEYSGLDIHQSGAKKRDLKSSSGHHQPCRDDSDNFKWTKRWNENAAAFKEMSLLLGLIYIFSKQLDIQNGGKFKRFYFQLCFCVVHLNVVKIQHFKVSQTHSSKGIQACAKSHQNKRSSRSSDISAIKEGNFCISF